MRITPFGENVDCVTRRILGAALELTCIALRVGECDAAARQAIADKIIALAKAGERNPNVLCEHALKDIRRLEIKSAEPPDFTFKRRLAVGKHASLAWGEVGWCDGRRQ